MTSLPLSCGLVCLSLSNCEWGTAVSTLASDSQPLELCPVCSYTIILHWMNQQIRPPWGSWSFCLPLYPGSPSETLAWHLLWGCHLWAALVTLWSRHAVKIEVRKKISLLVQFQFSALLETIVMIISHRKHTHTQTHTSTDPFCSSRRWFGLFTDG